MGNELSLYRIDEIDSSRDPPILSYRGFEVGRTPEEAIRRWNEREHLSCFIPYMVTPIEIDGFRITIQPLEQKVSA
ncbi:MAG: hypothetical protein AABX12_00890 [Nanoarchaeota archaeon]